uniref:TNF_2 domain-containing protein n=1 Tax=Strongyloides venezuelensis TaxID=75913 RepID=A0A0K0FV53_STRVS
MEPYQFSVTVSNTIISSNDPIISNEEVISNREKENPSNECLVPVIIEEDGTTTPIENEHNFGKFKKSRGLLCKNSVYKSFMRNMSRSFSKQYLSKDKRKPLLSNPSIKVLHSSKIHGKILIHKDKIKKMLSNKLKVMKNKIAPNNKELLDQNADVQAVRSKYSLSKSPKNQSNFLYGFNIQYYKSITTTTFEIYIEAMKIFYTTFTYKIYVRNVGNNFYKVFFNYYNILDSGNVAKVIVNLTYLNISNGICSQSNWDVSRDQTSFDFVKPANTVILFELYQEGMNEDEHFGKGFAIF